MGSNSFNNNLYLWAKTAVFGLSLVSATIVEGAQNRILDRLEKGETVSTKSGSSFMVQALVSKEYQKVSAALGDMRKISQVFSQVAFARPYVTKDGRQFVYLKLRGMGDGLGALMEVKSSDIDAFTDAKELVLSGKNYRSRDVGSEGDISKDPATLMLQKEIDEAKAAGKEVPFMGATTGITLEGPLNEVMQLPNIRMVVHLGFSGYSSANSSSSGSSQSKTYLVAKVAFTPQVSRENLGDYRGFGEHRLSVAEAMGKSVIESLKERLQNL